MWSAQFDPQRQLLQIEFAQAVPAQEAKDCAERVTLLLADAEKGFALLTDLSQLQQMELTCRPWIDQMMDLLNAKGVRKVVRVIPNPEKDIGFGIMSLFHYRREVRVVTCKDMTEAKAHLPSSGT